MGTLLALLISTAICSGSIYLLQLIVNGLHLPERPTTLVIGLTIAAFFIAMGFAARSLQRFFSPLDALLDASERLSDGQMDVHVRERGGPEVRALIRSFNGMVEQLRLQSEDRQNLLADVTHELRTPLTIIQGNIEGMLDGVYARDEQQLNELLRETQRMSELVEDLRILALAERGGLTIRKEPIDLIQLASETIVALRPRAEAKKVILELSSAHDLPQIKADPLRIGQVLTNLLINALHHTTSGNKIAVDLSLAERDRILIRIADNGTGITQEDLPHIFDRFYKSQDSQGSGLGLAIVKSLVEAHQGSITAQSSPGSGTEMTILLPTDETSI
jgi:two-component system sensor histidine kinase BaeS